MKIFCKTHGCHFPTDFETAANCPMWKEWGLKKLSKKYKKVIWQWYFTLPLDEIFINTEFAISIGIHGQKVKPGNEFERNVPFYGELTEEQQQILQREYFKYCNELDKEMRSKIFIDAFLKTLDKKIVKRKAKI